MKQFFDHSLVTEVVSNNDFPYHAVLLHRKRRVEERVYEIIIPVYLNVSSLKQGFFPGGSSSRVPSL